MADVGRLTRTYRRRMTDSPMTIIRKATTADVPALSQSMARAFYDDPVVGHWCLADEAKRMARLERIFALWLHQVYMPHGECYTDEQLRGGAFWLPPGTWKLGAFAQLRLIARTARITGGATPRIVRALTALEAKHPHDPHYYLQFLGVEPQAQNQGRGSALLRPVLDRCDNDRVPAYLESSNERNVPLYERHGFAIVEEIHLPGGGPTLWRMWRQPRAA
jgi:GNAT superfamily N-acetyltransferase